MAGSNIWKPRGMFPRAMARLVYAPLFSFPLRPYLARTVVGRASG